MSSAPPSHRQTPCRSLLTALFIISSKLRGNDPLPECSDLSPPQLNTPALFQSIKTGSSVDTPPHPPSSIRATLTSDRFLSEDAQRTLARRTPRHRVTGGDTRMCACERRARNRRHARAERRQPLNRETSSSISVPMATSEIIFLLQLCSPLQQKINK